MTRTIQIAYRYRLTPTPAQESLMRQFAGARRFVWNWALNRRIEHYQATKKTLKFEALCLELTELKRQEKTAWLRLMHAQSLQQALRDLESAYQNFFRRIRNGEKKCGFPKFKSKHRDMPRFRMPQEVKIDGSFVIAPKIGRIRAIIHRPIEGELKSATFSQEANGHWYVSFTVQQQAPERTDRLVRTHIGIDLGLKSFATLSDGTTIDNPRWYRTQQRKLRRAQQSLARKIVAQGQSKTSSKNREKARKRVANIHRGIRNRRNDFLHKLSHQIVRDHDLISIEDLNVRGLAKTKLAKSVMDASWAAFRHMLTYKADRNDKHLIIIGRFYPSSKTCHQCGTVYRDLTLSERFWTCSACGQLLDRDLNAAINIDQEGLRQYQQSRQELPRHKTPVETELVHSIRVASVDEAGSRRL